MSVTGLTPPEPRRERRRSIGASCLFYPLTGEKISSPHPHSLPTLPGSDGCQEQLATWRLFSCPGGRGRSNTCGSLGEGGGHAIFASPHRSVASTMAALAPTGLPGARTMWSIRTWRSVTALTPRGCLSRGDPADVQSVATKRLDSLGAYGVLRYSPPFTVLLRTGPSQYAPSTVVLLERWCAPAAAELRRQTRDLPRS